MRAAGSLLDAGLGEGDRVAFCLPSSAGLLCAVLGALRVGIVPVLLNATLLDREREVLLEDAAPSLTVVDRDQLDRLDAGPPATLAPHPLARPMHYTSGTTGRAKGVWSGLWDAPTAAAAFADEADLWSFGPADVHLVCSPMYHSVSIRFAGGTLLRGGTCVILPTFDAATAGDALDGGSGAVPTTTFLAPSALARLLADPGSVRSRFASASSPGPRRVSLSSAAQAGRLRPAPLRRPLGVLRIDRGPVHRVLARRVARAPGHGGPRPGGAHPPRGPRRDGLVPAAGVRAVLLLAGRGRDRSCVARRCLHRRRPRPARRGRVPHPRRQARRPDHHRWGQRLPGGGGGRPRRRGRCGRAGRLRARRRAVGAAGVRCRGAASRVRAARR